MGDIFYSCSNLTELDLSSFNINNVIDMRRMLSSCEKLNRIIINKINFLNFKKQISIYKIKFK